MRFLLPILLAIATPVFACCPVDPDSLLAESGDEGLVNLIAGRVLRDVPELWQTRIAELKEAPLAEVVRDIEVARGLSALGKNADALKLIQPHLTGDHTPEVLLELDIQRTQCALALWWQGGGEGYTLADCLMIAENASARLHDGPLYAYILRWVGKGERADLDAFLPDFFDLRYSTSKDAPSDNGELKRLGLTGAEAFLLAQIRRDPLWENFDTFYALSMIYMCSGRQNLAHYTRRRAWELHESGQHSRVPGAAEITDIRPLTVFRQGRAGVLVPVKVVSDESRSFMDSQYEARRAHALTWLAARREFGKQRIDAGWSALDPQFWADFVPPKALFPPLEPTAAAPVETPAESPAVSANLPADSQTAKPDETTQTKTWVALSVLLVILVVGGLAKLRMSRSAAKLEEKE
jgi:hypothetical protein